MKTALLHIIQPTFESDGERHQWRGRLSNIVHTAQLKPGALQMLGENVALIDLEKSLPQLSSLLYQLDAGGHPYRISFLDTDLDWLEFPKI